MWIDQHGSEVLQRNECLRLLALVANEGGVCRLAVATSGAPIIVPVNFAYENEGVVIRIAKGTIGDIAFGSLVAIEVDRVDEGAGEAWSVLLRGFARVLSPTTPQHRIGGSPDLSFRFRATSWSSCEETTSPDVAFAWLGERADSD